MRLSEEERAELRELARSESLRKDMMTVAENRHNQYNEFLNHPRKPFRPFIETNMKL